MANGLRHHVLEWGEGERVLVALHGFLDLAYAFDSVAKALVERGFHVFAADARGHGETDWVGAGGYYHFPDYVLDLELWTRALELERFHLVGHSMGGTVATLFAGARASRPLSLVSIEGIGPPKTDLDSVAARFSRWLDAAPEARLRPQKPLASVEEALARMRVFNPKLPTELGLEIAARATKKNPHGEGLVFRYDPLHRTQSPTPYDVAVHGALLERIAAPTLVVLGENGLRLQDEAERIAKIPNVRVEELAGVGHMIHWEAPEALASLIEAHCGGDCGRSDEGAE